MNVTNQTSQDLYFGPLHLLPNAINFYIDDTTATSLYLTNDAVADALNNALEAGKIQVTGAALPFPRPTGTPQILHGDGSPEGLVFASQGSVFMRRDNAGANTAMYAKTTGVTFSTGWQAFAEAAPVIPATTLPGSPSDGQQAILVDSTTTPSYVWLLQYSDTAGGWLFLGGSPLTVAVTSTTLPNHNGDYYIEAKGWANTGGGTTTGSNQSATLTVGGTTQDTQDTSNVPANSGAIFSYGGSSSFWGVGGLAARVTGATGGATVAITGVGSNPLITIIPIKLTS